MKGSLLIIGNFLSATGGSRGVCEELAERLAADGWEVLTASRKRPKFFRLADMVLTAVRHRHDYSVAQLDVFSGPAFVWAETVCWTLRRLGKPYVLTLHGGNLPTFAARWPGRVKRLLSSAKAVTAPSGYLKEALAPFCGKIRVIPNPIDIGLYPFRERAPAGPRLIWLRAFHEIYNPVMAVKVVAALAKVHPDLELDMVGPDKRDGSLQRARSEANVAGVNGRVKFRGPVAKSEVPKVLSKADIFLNTANVDNTPVSVVEAMACGLAIVSTNVGGVPVLIEDGVDGMLVPRSDAPAMAAAAQRILTEPVLAATLSQNARGTAQRLDWAVILPCWEALLDQLSRPVPP
jgi:glycosyltransferase involved in cell wall biosynthesis